MAALPRHDISTTIEQAISLSAEGYRVTAHLPARAYQTEDQLRRDLDKLRTGCVSDLLIVSGDPRNTRPAYSSSAELAAAIEQNARGQFRIGVAGYPEGHPVTGLDLASLQAKQKYASSLVTQMCIDPKVVADYSGRLRNAAVNLPILGRHTRPSGQDASHGLGQNGRRHDITLPTWQDARDG
ncbi:methylenetetrahydrofolate reductase [Pseudarthrobacter oxydans]|uniref:methylenetetrahydrofolate reductase n=1 Tax=Pseudarthrobacter oxydans TaxID=1671 RepID=UPI00382207B3